jgi:molybdopterin molybdotransferase
MIDLPEARARIIADVATTQAEIVGLAQAVNRVLAKPVIARVNQPPADLSAMDGYALRLADGATGRKLRVAGSAPAGHPFTGGVPPGACVRLFTGSVIPAGLDAILIQENTSTPEPGWIEITHPVAPGRHIRAIGQDFATGHIVVAAGTKLTPRHIGLCASAGHAWLAVHRRPRVAVLATGDEIALPGEPLPDGGIYGGNGPALCALAENAGAEATLLPATQDDAGQITRLVAGLNGYDLILTIGGASVGAHDLVQQSLVEAGMKLDFWKIAMRPGKPLLYGKLGAQTVIGVPGNPVAALLCAALFMRPLIKAMLGTAPKALPTEPARLGAPLKANDQRLDFLRATISRDNQGLIATPLPRQDSAAQSDFVAADALLLREPHAAAAEPGEWVQMIRMHELGL